MTEYRGCWRQHCDPKLLINHSWTIRVYRTASPKILAAYARAKNAYDADLSEARDYLNYNEGPYGFARFERRKFRWGKGLSMLTLSAQDGIYAPNNGHLTYEVWGITRDGRHTVIASAEVTHPNLPDWGDPKVRDAETIDALKKDNDYKLIEACSSNQFQPSLTAVDRLIGSLKLE
jgi:hypothetical protein